MIPIQQRAGLFSNISSPSCDTDQLIYKLATYRLLFKGFG